MILVMTNDSVVISLCLYSGPIIFKKLFLILQALYTITITNTIVPPITINMPLWTAKLVTSIICTGQDNTYFGMYEYIIGENGPILSAGECSSPIFSLLCLRFLEEGVDEGQHRLLDFHFLEAKRERDFSVMHSRNPVLYFHFFYWI